GRQPVVVRGIALDDFFGQQDAAQLVDIIKMDIQGAEMLALQGMAWLLARSEKLLLFAEFWPLGPRRFGVDAADYLATRRRHDSRIYHIDEQARTVTPAADAALLGRYTPELGNYTNLLCVKSQTPEPAWLAGLLTGPLLPVHL